MLLPVMQEYEMAGEFSKTSRLKSAVFRHIRGFLILGALGVACWIYLFFEGKLTIQTTPVFLIVLSNCWGLLLIIVLLGYGLVEIPRSFWKAGNNSARLCDLYVKATVLAEGMVDTKYALEEIIKLLNVASYKLPKESNLQESLNFVLSLCPLELLEHQRSMQTHLSKDAASQLGNITESTLVKLHKELKDTLSEYQRSKFRWDQMIDEALYLEDIITASDSPFHRISFTFQEGKTGFAARNREIIEFYWLTKVKPLCYRILAVVFMIMSLLTFLGETTLFLDFPIGVYPIMFQSDHGIVVTQLLCVFPLFYIILCTYFGLFNLKLSGWYGLYPNNHTDSSNLVWSAFFLARLSAPMCNNFLLYLKVRNTVYSEVMELIDVVPLVGAQFSTFFPLLLVLFCGLNLFHVYGRAMGAIGMSSLSFNDKYRFDKVSEGKIIVTRARTTKERNNVVYNRNNGNWEMTKKQSEDPRKELPFRRAI